MPIMQRFAVLSGLTTKAVDGLWVAALVVMAAPCEHRLGAAF
jgi:hypothetical protein